jgi:hypothetical protein
LLFTTDSSCRVTLPEQTLGALFGRPVIDTNKRLGRQTTIYFGLPIAHIDQAEDTAIESSQHGQYSEVALALQ